MVCQRGGGDVFLVREGNAVRALQTRTEQVGHRVRSITTGGRSRVRATTEEIDLCVNYLELVADSVEQYGFVVDSVAVDGRKPISGRIRIRRPAGGAEVAVGWQRGFGWFTSTHGPGAPREGWFHLYADDAATPATVSGFLLDGILPAELPTTAPKNPGRSTGVA
jgi:hypothetical protein